MQMKQNMVHFSKVIISNRVYDIRILLYNSGLEIAILGAVFYWKTLKEFLYYFKLLVEIKICLKKQFMLKVILYYDSAM